ncbi:hypothetical protein SAMN05660484_00580 [Eubacterium ruminantium]|uniref:Uncharacterized protein n=1 Tax=Eubacterium ruminantium TaxID=42322 RepID=A0A1T4KRL0_9FIRM|nr:hypothetical protein [Eubacterium ruminantium]SCW34244.1 hypothetical protein SAMN05660484_00580 [Eubacterium ruminantium]SDM32596.1 hypothetical protein SAMN04490370_102244 [Eubacterium ruminantium]SJZ45055.1 hypothetical protein SAMN02745110_00535 [Eubacterium ruminantium]
MFYIENDRLKAGFEAHGAELRSLVDKTTGEEYMWCGDPAFWGRVSPVLFPVVGNYKNMLIANLNMGYQLMNRRAGE